MLGFRQDAAKTLLLDAESSAALATQQGVRSAAIPDQRSTAQIRRASVHLVLAEHEFTSAVPTVTLARPLVLLPRDVGNVTDSVASLEVLLQRVACGRHDAFTALHEQVSPRVMGLVVRLLRDRSQSEEVTQEVFLQIWEKASRFDEGRGTALAWILRMTHGCAVDRIRKAQRVRNRDLRVGIRDFDVEFDSVTEAVEVRAEINRVRQAMTQLTALQREAVALAYYGGYSYDEIAGLLGIPASTVKTRVRDGVMRLRRELGVPTP